MMLINIAGKIADLSSPKVMGIINVTPDSFYAGSRYNVKDSVKIAEQFITHDCDIIDLGAYSSWIYSKDISNDEEWSRLEPALKAIRKAFPDIPISIDTFRAKVAYNAINEGANIINDISGGALDTNMFDVISRYNVPYILMHMRGNPQNMHNFDQYDNLIIDIMDYFKPKIAELRYRKVKDIILDPGFGFSKNLDQNYSLLTNLDKLLVFDLPILVGISRKSMIYKLLGTSPADALNGTSVLNFVALSKGANILRVHDVKEAKEVVALYNRLV